MKKNCLQFVSRLKETVFYNACSSPDAFSMTTEELVDVGYNWAIKQEAITVGPQVWYPAVTVTDNRLIFYLQFLFFQLLPALLLDGIIKLATKQKPL